MCLEHARALDRDKKNKDLDRGLHLFSGANNPQKMPRAHAVREYSLGT